MSASGILCLVSFLGMGKVTPFRYFTVRISMDKTGWTGGITTIY